MTLTLVKSHRPQACSRCGTPMELVVDDVRDFFVSEGKSDAYSIHRCSHCASGETFPPATDRELAAFYPETYEAYNDRRGLRARLQRWRYRADLRFLRGFVAAPARLFEIGSGRGEFLETARDAGYSVAGVEPSAAGREAAARRGLALQPGFGTDFSFPEKQDVVVMRHVLEHVADPAALARKIATEGLRPGGFLVVKIPNADSWEARAFDRYWSNWDLPRHRSHFGPTGIARLLSDAGFAHVTVRFECVPIDIVRSLGFFARHSPRPTLTRFLARLVSHLPIALTWPVAQLLALARSGAGPGRMVVVARLAK